MSWRERRWTPEEDQLIRENYPDDGANGIAARIGCYPSLVRNRARWLGVNLLPKAKRRSRAEANLKIGNAHRRHIAIKSGAPTFLVKHEEYSRSWYLAQQHAFSEAMKLNPTERPS